MSFSPGQQGHYRPLVEKAWQRHCKDTDSDPADKVTHDKWYRAQLMQAIGVDTTSKASKTVGFDKLMAHFEGIARDGIHWQTEGSRGPARRILFALRKWCGKNRRDEDYLRRIARQMLKLKELPQLDTLTEQQLATVQRAVIIDHKRRAKRDEDPTQAQPSNRPYTRNKTNHQPTRLPAYDVEDIDPNDIPY